MSNGLDDFLVFLLGMLLFVGMPIAVCADQNKKTQINKDRRSSWLKRRVEYRVKNNINATQRYMYNTCEKDIDVDFILDEKQKSVFASDSTGYFIKIPFDEIAGCETIINNQSSGGIGRAVAGGILAGGAGAIIGAVTAKQRVNSYKLIIYRKNIDSPKFIYNLIKNSSDTQIENNLNVKEATEFSQNVTACIKAIIAQNEMNSQKKEENKLDKNENLEKRLKSLDNLFKKGLISEEEYNKKRDKILNDL